MKRSGYIKRSSPLSRKRGIHPKRSRRERKQTEADKQYLEAVRGLPCCAPRTLVMNGDAALAESLKHDGRIHAHHAGRKPGTSLKAPDSTAIPLCDKHHRQWHDANGVFKWWSKADRRYWADAAISDVRRILEEKREAA